MSLQSASDVRLHILYATPGHLEQVRDFLLLDEVKIISVNQEDFSHILSEVSDGDIKPGPLLKQVLWKSPP